MKEQTKTCLFCKFYKAYIEKNKNTNWDGFCFNKRTDFDPVLKSNANSIFSFKLFPNEVIYCMGFEEKEKVVEVKNTKKNAKVGIIKED